MSHVAEIRNALQQGIQALEQQRAQLQAQQAQSLAAAEHQLQAARMSSPVAQLQMQLGAMGTPSLIDQYAGLTIQLRNAHGRHLQLDDKGGITHSPNDGGWELMTLLDQKDGTVYIHCPATDHVVGANDNKQLVIGTKSRGGWEKWRLEPAGNGKLLLVSAHGTQLSCDDNGRVYQSPNKAGWEQWDVVVKSGTSPYMAQRAALEQQLSAAQQQLAQAEAQYQQQVATINQQNMMALQQFEQSYQQKVAAKQQMASQLEAHASQIDQLVQQIRNQLPFLTQP